MPQWYSVAPELCEGLGASLVTSARLYIFLLLGLGCHHTQKN